MKNNQNKSCRTLAILSKQRLYMSNPISPFLTVRVKQALRRKIRRAANASDKTESEFTRHHLAKAADQILKKP